jgi:glycosyltransferase involved in cell wall biosynthesis
MTRVLMTADAVGGVWTYACDLARALVPCDVEVTLAVMGPAPAEEQLRQATDAGIVDVVALPFRLEWMDDPWPDVDAAGDRLVELAAYVGADVVHLNGFVHAALAWGRPVVVVAQSDVVSWWWHVHHAPPPPEWDTYRSRVGAGLRAASAVVTLTQAGREDLRRHYGVDATTTIANGRQLAGAAPRPKEPLVVGAGRLWDEAKNLRALEAAAVGLDWPVVLAGDAGPGRRPNLVLEPASDGEAALPRAGAGAHLLGRVPFAELATWLARAAVFASPARYEPFGLAAVEAALAGCALVLGGIDTAHEVWGDAAAYVDPSDHGALHATLQELVRDPQRCREQAERAQARAQRLTPDRMATAYATLYRSLVAEVTAR